MKLLLILFTVVITVTAGTWVSIEYILESKRPVRIMPLGDSITAGYTDNPNWIVPFEFGYRSGLYTRLVNAGCNVQYVGQSPEPWDGKFGSPENIPTLDLRALGQDNHRGYGGQKIGKINRNVARYITNDKPDVILLLVGINGINDKSPRRLKILVDTIITAKPKAHLIVAQIPPYAHFNQNLWDFNVYIRDTLIPTYADEGYNISTVDLYSLFLDNAEDPTSITLGRHANLINHPTNILYNQMAQAWFDGLQQILEFADC